MPTEIVAEARLATARAAENSQVQKGEEVKKVSKIVERQDLSAKEQPVPPAEESKQVSNQKIEQVAEELNKHVQNLKRDLHFSVNEDTGEVVIKVVDSESQRMIRTIPSDEVFNMREKLNESVGVLFNAKA